MKHKWIFISIACLTAIIAGILYFGQKAPTTKTVTISADYPKYDNLENLVEKADTIIKGKVIDYTYSDLNVTEESQPDDELQNPGGEKDNSTIPYTIFTVEIEEAYKEEKDTIQIKTLGGIVGDTEYVLEDSSGSNIEEGKKYVFFLETYANSPASLLNSTQSSYEYDEHGNIIRQGKEMGQNEINFTIEDLENIDSSK